jgi:hypothetical protein
VFLEGALEVLTVQTAAFREVPGVLDFCKEATE